MSSEIGGRRQEIYRISGPRIQEKRFSAQDLVRGQDRIQALRPSNGSKEAVPAYEWWSSLCDENFTLTELRLLVTEQSHINPDLSMKLQTLLRVDLSQVQPRVFLREASKVFKIFYGPAQKSLDSWLPAGFNNHTFKEHVSVVAQRTMDLLIASGADNRTINLGILAALMHDIGNTIHRNIHPHASIEMVIKAANNPSIAEWAIAMLAAESHDESMAGAIIDHLLEESKEMSVLVQSIVFLEWYMSLVDPVGSAVILADKSQSGRVRALNTKPPQISAFTDLHIGCNFVMDGVSKLVISDDGQKMTCLMPYNFYARPELEKKYPNVVESTERGSRKKLIFPESLRPSGADVAETFFTKWTREMVILYEKRLGVMAVNAFNLFSQLTAFEIRFFELETPQDIRESKSVPTYYGRQQSVIRYHRASIVEDLGSPKLVPLAPKRSKAYAG